MRYTDKTFSVFVSSSKQALDNYDRTFGIKKQCKACKRSFRSKERSELCSRCAEPDHARE